MAILFLVLLTFFHIPVFSVVGKHNITFSMGGGFDSMNITDVQLLNSNTIQEFSDKLFGGGFEVELGYSNYRIKNNRMIYGIDTRATVSMAFLDSNNKDHSIISFNKMYTIVGYMGVTLQLGYQFSRFKFLADVLGFNVGGGALMEYSNKISSANKIGNSFLIGLNLPGGFHIVFNNGFSIGVRHKIKFFLPIGMGDWYKDFEGNRNTDIINYNIYMTLGFVLAPKIK